MNLNHLVSDLVSGPPVASALTMLLLYAGPESVLPLVSALATFIGLLLMWWRRAREWARALVQFCRKKTGKRTRLE